MRIAFTIEVTRDRRTETIPERETQLDSYVEHADRAPDRPTIGFRSIDPD